MWTSQLIKDLEGLAADCGVEVTNRELRDFAVDFLNKEMGVSISCFLDTFIFNIEDRETVENIIQQLQDQI